MFGWECPNCGMLPFACVCIPWCWKHDVAEPCELCGRDLELIPEAKPIYFVPILVLLMVLIVYCYTR